MVVVIYLNIMWLLSWWRSDPGARMPAICTMLASLIPALFLSLSILLAIRFDVIFPHASLRLLWKGEWGIRDAIFLSCACSLFYIVTAGLFISQHPLLEQVCRTLAFLDFSTLSTRWTRDYGFTRGFANARSSRLELFGIIFKAPRWRFHQQSLPFFVLRCIGGKLLSRSMISSRPRTALQC